jgi:hypothetical protein
MQARQDTILYKRHARDCAVNETKLPISKRRFWFECDCPIWIEGRTPAGEIIRRQSTGTRDTATAEAFRTSLLETPTEQHGPAIGVSRGGLRISKETHDRLNQEKKRTGVPITTLVDRAVKILIIGEAQPTERRPIELPLSLATEVAWLVDLFNSDQDDKGELLKVLIRKIASEWKKSSP